MTWLLACLATLVVLALPYVATQLLRSLEARPPGNDSPRLDQVGAIIVLGGDFLGHAPEMGGDTVGPLTLQRLQYAARLHRHSGIPVLLTGGVIGRNGRPLSESMAQVLSEDFNAKARWIERTATSTRENARNSKAILEREGISQICLITHGFHMVRAKNAFAHLGFEVIAAPTLCLAKPAPLWRDFVPNEMALYRSLQAVREWCGRAWYAFLNWRENAGYRYRFRRPPAATGVEARGACDVAATPAASRMNAIAGPNPGSDE